MEEEESRRELLISNRPRIELLFFSLLNYYKKRYVEDLIGASVVNEPSIQDRINDETTRLSLTTRRGKLLGGKFEKRSTFEISTRDSTPLLYTVIIELNFHWSDIDRNSIYRRLILRNTLIAALMRGREGGRGLTQEANLETVVFNLGRRFEIVTKGRARKFPLSSDSVEIANRPSISTGRGALKIVDRSDTPLVFLLVCALCRSFVPLFSHFDNRRKGKLPISSIMYTRTPSDRRV